jgi:hypothetical protein
VKASVFVGTSLDGFIARANGALDFLPPDGWQPSAGHVRVTIWPDAVPDAIPNPKPESVGSGGGANDVSQPTMTGYAARGRNTGAAVVVFLWAHEDEDHATHNETDLSLRPDIVVRADSPPTFLLQAESKLPIAQWPQLLETWLGTIGMVDAAVER